MEQAPRVDPNPKVFASKTRLGLRSGKAWILADIDRESDQEAVPVG